MLAQAGEARRRGDVGTDWATFDDGLPFPTKYSKRDAVPPRRGECVVGGGRLIDC